MRTLLLAAAVLLTAQTFAAQPQRQAPPTPDSVFRLGPGAIYIQDPYKGVDADVYPIPMFIYRGERLTVFGPRATWSLFGEKDRWGVEALVRLRLEGYEDDDSRALTGMDDRDGTLELGLQYIHDFDFAVFSADFSHDVLGEHDGYEFRVLLSKGFNNALDVEGLRLTPRVGFNWRSGDLNDYYYGVRPGEALPGRPAYTADSSAGPLTALQVDYPLNDKWNLFGLVSIEWLANDITDSPIVDQDYITSALIGALYEF